MSDVTVHIDETLDVDTIQALQHDIYRMNGVEHIDSSLNAPHLMVVTYDNQTMNSHAILSAFTDHGLHAELIGF